LAFLDNIDELNTSWPDYQVMQCSQHVALAHGAPRRLGTSLSLTAACCLCFTGLPERH
jgi:hypothetical protein